jgi:hypothetical protein
MKIHDLIWDEAVYPRAAVSQNTVAAYVEALSIGAQFPPVMVQRVVNYPLCGDVSATVMILIDGVHRWHAFKQAGRTDIPVIHFQDAVLDYEAAKTELLLESARNNTSHGDRLTPVDKKRIARDIALSDPKCRYTETALAEKLGVTQQTVNAWITDIRARQKTNRDSIIIRLSRLGWPQEKIARTTKMTQGRVAQIINNTSFGKINNLLSQGRDMEYIAGHYNMELAHENTKPGASLAFLNADWYDFESTPAAQEDPGGSITIFDYHRLLTQAGWKVIRRIESPLSTERLTGSMVKKMQDKRILGTTGRTLLIARRI